MATVIFCDTDKCKSWVHPKSNDLNFIDFQRVNGMMMTHLPVIRFCFINSNVSANYCSEVKLSEFLNMLL